MLVGMRAPFNISLYPGTGTADGIKGDHILIAPPYNIKADEVRMIMETTTAVIKSFFNES